MTIHEICGMLKQELYENGYRYGFYYQNRTYVPDPSIGFDSEFARLIQTVYRIQNPMDTIREKAGTCLDAVMVMKTILEPYKIPYKIWHLHHRVKNKNHAILTFEAEGKIVYLELTPQSNKPWYGQELLYQDEQQFVEAFQKEQYDTTDVTGLIQIGASPDLLFS